MFERFYIGYRQAVHSNYFLSYSQLVPDQQRVFQLDLIHCLLLSRQVLIHILMPSYIRYHRYEPLQFESYACSFR
ncbi:Uncharacterised protein [Streptococcus pneumoniae]|nr:Uncharacterised protein [Streptococcus pneumoniae]